MAEDGKGFIIKHTKSIKNSFIFAYKLLSLATTIPLNTLEAGLIYYFL
jgi:hypothetical protein